MPVRALFSSFLLAVILATAVTASPAAAATKSPVAKIALGAKQAKKKTKKKAKKVVKKVVKTSAKTSVMTTPPAQSVAAPAAPVTCENTDLVPDAGNLDLIRAAILCLHNQVRAQNGLSTLAENGLLDAAGTGHSADMVARDYFDHTTPEGGTFDQRIFDAHYVGKNDGYSLGENLAWGTGQLSTPAGMMNSWMNSEHHRENILQPAYREIGLGISLGTPAGTADGITVSAEFGARS